MVLYKSLPLVSPRSKRDVYRGFYLRQSLGSFPSLSNTLAAQPVHANLQTVQVATVAKRRAKEISGYGAPRTFDDFLSRAHECLNELRALSNEFPNVVSEDDQDSRDKLDNILRLLEEVEEEPSPKDTDESFSGGGGPPDPPKGPPPKKEKKRNKLITAIRSFCQKVASVALSIGRALAAASVSAAKAVIPPAWNAFWQGVGMAVVGIIQGLFGGGWV